MSSERRSAPPSLGRTTGARCCFRARDRLRKDSVTDPLDLLRQAVIGRIISIDPYFGTFIRVELDDERRFRLAYCDWSFTGPNVSICSVEVVPNQPGQFDALVGRSIVSVVCESASRIVIGIEGEITLQVVADLEEYDPDDELLAASAPKYYVTAAPATGLRIEGKLTH